MASSDAPGTRSDDDPAQVPARVFKLNESLLIDGEIRKRIGAPRSPRIALDEKHAVSFGRRALEIAIHSACSARQQNPPRSDWESGWIDLRDSSDIARNTLERTLRALRPSGQRASDYSRSLGATRLGRSSLTVNQINQRAKRDALILLAAKTILRKLSQDSERRRRELLIQYPNSFDFEKRAFVARLMEGWIYLTKTRPGKNPNALNNPFLQLVEAAWVDWCGEYRADDISFAHPLSVGLEAITEAEVARLAKDGPSWR